jgi:hypothetical protein
VVRAVAADLAAFGQVQPQVSDESLLTCPAAEQQLPSGHDDATELDAIWERRTDAQVVAALAHPEEYSEEAVAAAKHQAEARGLGGAGPTGSSQNIPATGATLDSVVAGVREDDAAKAAAPLNWGLRILMMLLPIGIPQLLLATYYESRGYSRRGREAWQWMGYGLLLLVARVILGALLP